MPVANWTEADSQRALTIWQEYEGCHDLSAKSGQTAAIEPATGRIWFGGSIQEIVAQRDAQGESGPLFFVRVGSDTYYRKGRRK